MVYELPLPPPTISDYTSIYCKKQTDRFLTAFSKKAVYNTNMDECFYDRQTCDEIMETPENDLEKKWKTRILLETTPRGNIIMHYNPFKNAFVYYCDNSSLPYSILNAVVMKYVVLYRCIDLFIDEYVTTEPSPMIEIIKAYEKEKDKKPDSEKLALPKSKAFAKFKNYSKSSPEKDITVPVIPKMINSIVYMGKIVNFSLIQKLAIKSIGFKSNILEGLDGQPKIKSWREFKQKKEEKSAVQQFIEETTLANDAIDNAVETIDRQSVVCSSEL